MGEPRATGSVAISITRNADLSLVPAILGPPSPPTQQLCPQGIDWCQRLIEKLCHRYDCAKVANTFRGTAEQRKGNNTEARKLLSRYHDAAFEPPWNGAGFQAHHIVAQGNPYGVPTFAQWLLKHVGIKANDIDNLAALRDRSRQKGKRGYQQLVAYEEAHPNAPMVSQRMAHADTTYKYYYEKVNEVFAAWIRSHHNQLPNERQVRDILRSIKIALYAGGKDFIKAGPTERSGRKPAA